MILLPSDKEYKATKKIMRGEAVINPDFRPVADYIDETFGVRVLNILYDTFGKDKRPRIDVHFEFEREKRSFDCDGSTYGFDPEKQKKIAQKFRSSLEERKSIKKKWFSLFNKEVPKYKTHNLWVVYSAFEPIAKIEANENIPEDEIKGLKKKLDNPELWEISRGYGGVTFFLFTDKQVKQYEGSPEKKMWEDSYFRLLEPYNEFGYFKRKWFSIYLDSKENFDKNYGGNWYYYYK